MAFVLAAKLGGAVVAHQIARLAGIFPFADEHLRSVQFYRLGILQRQHVHYFAECPMESGSAHTRQHSQFFDRYGLIQFAVNMIHSSRDLLHLTSLL